MSALRRWAIALGVLVLGRKKRQPRFADRPRIVPPGDPDPRAEWLVLALLLFAAAAAVGFIVVYSFNHLAHQTQYLGLSLGLAFAFGAAALIVVGKRLVVTEELEEDYPLPHPTTQEELEQLVEESGDRFTRKRLLLTGAGAAVSGAAGSSSTAAGATTGATGSGLPRAATGGTNTVAHFGHVIGSLLRS